MNHKITLTMASELAAMLDLAQDVIVPVLGACADVRTNVFDFPRVRDTKGICDASLDMLADRTLVELKSTGKTATASMQKEQVLQLIAYVLRDWDDRFGFERVMFYQARYGAVMT